LSFQNAQDYFDTPGGIAENIVVPKADHPPAVAFQPSCSLRVYGIGRVLPAVQLDH
jgi:hypothetical protein